MYNPCNDVKEDEEIENTERKREMPWESQYPKEAMEEEKEREDEERRECGRKWWCWNMHPPEEYPNDLFHAGSLHPLHSGTNRGDAICSLLRESSECTLQSAVVIPVILVPNHRDSLKKR